MKTFRKVVAAVILTIALPLSARQPVQTAPVEILPDHIVRRIITDQTEQTFSQLAASGGIAQGVIVGAKRWRTDAPISVCFFGGSAALRSRIVATASAWEKLGAPVVFDFGNRQDPTICRTNRSYDIRIGYTQPGYWSMIGQDSLIHVGQFEQSMNFSRFDYAPPQEPEFSRVVLHEFGHALGFNHEHQQESDGCENEFDWDAIYSYLSGPPNNWSKETIDFNLRSRKYMAGDVRTKFNRKSIMLYTFPTNFYKKSQQSRCYSPGNVALSEGDIELLKSAYGSDAEFTPKKSVAALVQAAKTLPSAERIGVENRVKFFNASQATKNQVMRVGNSKFTDVDIKACSTTDATKQLVEDATQFLNAESKLGMLRYKGIHPQAAPGITILADFTHPEFADAKRLETSLSSRFSGKVKMQENPGMDRWLLTVIVCGDTPQ